MRVAALVLLLPLIAVAPATAQVTINLRALDQIPEAHRPQRRAVPEAHRPGTAENRPVAAAAEAPKPAAPAAEQARQQPAGAPAAVATKLPTLPAAPPAPPPGQMVATLPPGPPAAPAGQTAPAQPRRLDLRFAPGQSSLPPDQAKSVAALAASAHALPGATFEVAAHAPEVGGDASSARRLSLDRALAVRAALIAGGVPAANVYMRALGAPPPSEAGQADDASITVMGANGGERASFPPPEQAKEP